MSVGLEAPQAGTGFDDLKAMMAELSAKMGVVHADIGAVREDLGKKIEEGNKATMDLKKRLDHNDDTFAERVAAVVAGLSDPQAGPTPVFSSNGQSSTSLLSQRDSYASCFSGSSSGGNSSSSSSDVTRKMFARTSKLSLIHI